MSDKVEIAFDTGGTFRYFESLTLTDTFLDPCQTMTCTIGADETRFEVLSTVKPGSFFTVSINGNPQCSGVVDSVQIEASRAGRMVSVAGRDFMSRVVDGNADPRLQIPESMPFDEFCQTVFEHFNFGDLTFFEENTVGRNMAVGKAIPSKGNKAKRRKRFKDPADYLRPKINEGGWQWFSRVAHRLGYHAWIMPDGSGIVVGTPDYEQSPAYTLTAKRSQGLQGLGAANNIKMARASLDITGLPSHVYVRGKSVKPGAVQDFVGFAENKNAPVFKPFYLCDSDSSTKAHCDALAMFILSKAQRNAQTYECVVRGASDPATGRVYNVDTVATVDDENCGVSGNMWVESRVFTYSRSTSETRLKLIPADALTMDYYVSDNPPPAADYETAASGVGPMTKPKLAGTDDIFAAGWIAIHDRAKAERGG